MHKLCNLKTTHLLKKKEKKKILVHGVLLPVCFSDFYLSILLNEEEVEKGSLIFLFFFPNRPNLQKINLLV